MIVSANFPTGLLALDEHTVVFVINGMRFIDFIFPANYEQLGEFELDVICHVPGISPEELEDHARNLSEAVRLVMAVHNTIEEATNS